MGGLLGLGTSVASMLAHAGDLETVVRAVANFASVTSILGAASEAAALAGTFQAVGALVVGCGILYYIKSWVVKLELTVGRN